MNRYVFDKHLLNLGVKEGDSVLVAVSGGMDSMALLHGLVNSSLGLKCSVAHMNFNLRGEESDGDESVVNEWCAVNNVDIFIARVETIKYAKERSISIEMAARNLRYEWFDKLMREQAFNFLAIAHNSNDNAETLLLNLVRGTGVRGLCAISETISYIIRPLLIYSREEIEKYIFNFNIPYRVDSTNLESDFARNRVRNEVLPHLKKINPSVISTLNRNIKYFTMANGILESLYRSKKRGLLRSYKGAEGVIYIDELLKDEHWCYWLFLILQEYGFNSANADDIARSIVDNEVKRYISDTHIVVKERGYLKIYVIKMANPLPDILIDSLPRVVKFGEQEFSMEILENSPDIQHKMKDIKNGLYLSADNLTFPIKCRSMVAGDKFIPLGMRGAKKVSDFLTDIKIDNILRSRTPILVLVGSLTKNNPGDEIICLPGLKINSKYMITPSTQKVLLIK